MWSERLDWGYYSKGPGVAATIRAGTAIFGVDEFGVRFFSPVLALGTSLVLFYGCTRRLYGEGAAGVAVVLLNVTPLFHGRLAADDHRRALDLFLVGGDGGLLAGAGTRRVAACRLGWWLVAGSASGWVSCANTPTRWNCCASCWRWRWCRRWRREFRRPGFYVMVLVAAVVGSPPVFWNALTPGSR